MKQVRLPRRQLPEIRAQFARMLDEDLPAKSIMAALKLSRSTFFEWRRAYETRGLEGLKVRPLPGATPKLTDQQTSQLRGWLVGRDPRQFQFDFALWTRKIVRDLIQQKFSVEMTPQGIGKLLHRLGLSPQRPLYRAYQQDPEAVRRWKEEEFPAIRAQARAVFAAAGDVGGPVQTEIVIGSGGSSGEAGGRAGPGRPTAGAVTTGGLMSVRWALGPTQVGWLSTP
ncbi:MAG: IS630 family transposase [Pseudonocardia sp.]